MLGNIDVPYSEDVDESMLRIKLLYTTILGDSPSYLQGSVCSILDFKREEFVGDNSYYLDIWHPFRDEPRIPHDQNIG